MKIEIVIKRVDQFRKINAVAIHLLEPTVDKITDAVSQAERDGFEFIYIYTKRNWDVRSNIFNGNSTWNQLRRIYGDVRAGEVGCKYGRSVGDGFTIYLEEAG